MEKNKFLLALKENRQLSLLEQMQTVFLLSIPGILGQLSTIIMQYIDAAMAGRLGPLASASIGLVSSSTWFCNGICTAASAGFIVLAAQKIGARDSAGFRLNAWRALFNTLLFSALIALLAALLSGYIPLWLRAETAIWKQASEYFLVFALFLPFAQIRFVTASLLQSYGDMKTPGFWLVILCVLDVIFNALLIFDGFNIGPLTIPGAGLSVLGAALGSGLSDLVIACILFGIFFKKTHLHQNFSLRQIFGGKDLWMGWKIGIPAGLERMIENSAYIAFTAIVAPLSASCVAANSFAITAESLCYMPAYGIASSAAAMSAQALGAKAKKMLMTLTQSVCILTACFMLLSGCILYFFGGSLIGFMSLDETIVALGTSILKIEAFAELMYGMSIAANGILRGLGDTLVPSILSLVSMWGIRIPLAAVLAGKYGLQGVWFAMALELNIRGILYLFRLAFKLRQISYESMHLTELAKGQSIS